MGGSSLKRTIEFCTTLENGQEASSEQTTSFASSVEVSLSVEYEASSIFQSASTQYGMAVTASTETAKSVSEAISATRSFSQCDTAEFTPGTDDWTQINAAVPGANVVDMYQWT